MIGDAYAFRSDVRQTIEHAPTENSLETDYSAVTYVYLEGPPSWDQTVPSVEREDEAPVGEAVDIYAPERQRSGSTPSGTLVLEEGPVNLMLKLVGMNAKSEGLGFDLITIQCDRIE